MALGGQSLAAGLREVDSQQSTHLSFSRCAFRCAAAAPLYHPWGEAPLTVLTVARAKDMMKQHHTCSGMGRGMVFIIA